MENMFSVLKRKFNGDLKARIFRIQIKEIANKMIVCHLHRFLQFFFVEFSTEQNLNFLTSQVAGFQLIMKTFYSEIY